MQLNLLTYLLIVCVVELLSRSRRRTETGGWATAFSRARRLSRGGNAAALILPKDTVCVPREEQWGPRPPNTWHKNWIFAKLL